MAKIRCTAIRKAHIFSEHVRNGSQPKSTHYQNGRCMVRETLDYPKRNQHTEERSAQPLFPPSSSTRERHDDDVGTRRSAPVPSRRRTHTRFYGAATQTAFYMFFSRTRHVVRSPSREIKFKNEKRNKKPHT